MKVFFVAALFRMDLQGHLGRGIRLWDDVFITNDRVHVSSLLTPEFRAAAGGIETHAIEQATAVLYRISTDSPALKPGPEAIARINAILAMSNLFLTCLWLIKDNSINTELGFLEHPYKPPKLQESHVSSNAWGSYFADARAGFGTSSFTADEIRRAREYFSLFDVSGVASLVEGGRFKNPLDTNRLDRVFFFLQGARAASDLAVRISHYVTCFETLFSTDNAELSHKLAERLAVFAGGDTRQKVEMYRAIKSAYAVRSNTVHGGKLNAKLARELPEISARCDSTLRDVLRIILSSAGLRKLFAGPPEAIESCMIELLFGAALSDYES